MCSCALGATQQAIYRPAMRHRRLNGMDYSPRPPRGVHDTWATHDDASLTHLHHLRPHRLPLRKVKVRVGDKGVAQGGQPSAAGHTV